MSVKSTSRRGLKSFKRPSRGKMKTIVASTAPYSEGLPKGRYSPSYNSEKDKKHKAELAARAAKRKK